MSWPYIPELLETPVPRYTSFPTAAEFGPGVGAAQAEQALQAVPDDVSLYVHIPFCEQICWYCGCNTGKSNRQQRLASYLDALHREIALTGARLGGRAKVRRIACGGGSPNVIAPTDFVRLGDALTLHTRVENPVWSIELDPRNLSREWGKVMQQVGITNASLGVQTFAAHLQAAIGRVQDDATIAGATELLRAAGITSLNFDLMYGLPGQTMADLEAALARTLELGADRIALFGYAHVPHLIPRQRRIDGTALPGQSMRFAMAEFGYAYLAAAGYTPIGFDHFARPADPLASAARHGMVRRNFLGFTDDQARVLIGVGASSISSFPDLIVQNEKNGGRYRMLLSQDRLPATLGIVRSAEDQALGSIIMALLCQGEAVIGSDRCSAVAVRLQPFFDFGLAELAQGTMRVLPHGRPYVRTIAALFDPYRQNNAHRFSSAV